MDADCIFTNIVSGASTTTVIKTGAGLMARITVNTPITNGTFTIYNNTTATGPKIATATLPVTVGNPFGLTYLANFSTGLTIVSTGAGMDFTVFYH